MLRSNLCAEEVTFFPCFDEASCQNLGDDELSCVQGVGIQYLKSAARPPVRQQYGSGPLRILEEGPATPMRPTRRTPKPPKVPRNSMGSMISGLPPTDSELYDEYVKRSVWGMLRSSVTKETMGYCSKIVNSCAHLILNL